MQEKFLAENTKFRNEIPRDINGVCGGSPCRLL